MNGNDKNITMNVGEKKRRKGFLPIETGLFDRIFIAGIVWILFNLLWLRFVESYFPLWVSTIISIIYALVIIIKG